MLKIKQLIEHIIYNWGTERTAYNAFSLVTCGILDFRYIIQYPIRESPAYICIYIRYSNHSIPLVELGANIFMYDENLGWHYYECQCCSIHIGTYIYMCTILYHFFHFPCFRFFFFLFCALHMRLGESLQMLLKFDSK